MGKSKYFKTISDWEQAAKLVDFKPRRPSFTAGFTLSSLAVHIMDHNQRQLPVSRRSLEAHYSGFSVDQKRTASTKEAEQQALSTSYGQTAREVCVAGHTGRGYALGPEPDPNDSDGRSPAVIVWHDDNMLYLIASNQLEEEYLLDIAISMYTL